VLRIVPKIYQLVLEPLHRTPSRRREHVSSSYGLKNYITYTIGASSEGKPYEADDESIESLQYTKSNNSPNVNPSATTI